MRCVLTVLMLVVWCHTTSAQQVVTDPINSVLPALEKLAPPQNLPSFNFEEEVDHYTCQRCGSENQVNWKTSIHAPEFIPHCNYCGKRYWPKFKPANAIPRTFCRLNLNQPELN